MKAHIGDRVIFPRRAHRHATDVTAGWMSGTVISTRGRGHVIVRDRYGFERVHPAYELRPYPRRRSEWPSVTR